MPSRPTLDQVEITVVGPGVGECCIVHIGGGEWLIVDSCLHKKSGKPAALHYLGEIGVSCEAVKYIFVSHWHDDHCAGISQTIASCRNAKICLSAALSRAEFINVVAETAVPKDLLIGCGLEEISAVYKIAKSARRPVWRAHADRRLFVQNGNPAANGLETSVWTLSPSDAQIEKFFVDIASMMPDLRAYRRRFPSANTNDLSVVTVVQVGQIAILLGADLEHTADKTRGWTPIVESSARPQEKACIFKVPHHGSENGHYDEVWTRLLIDKPTSIISPYAGGRKPLPALADIDRVKRHSAQTHITSKRDIASKSFRDNAVSKTLKELGLKVRDAEPVTGSVSLRNGGALNPSEWSVELTGGAYTVI